MLWAQVYLDNLCVQVSSTGVPSKLCDVVVKRMDFSVIDSLLIHFFGLFGMRVILHISSAFPSLVFHLS